MIDETVRRGICAELADKVVAAVDGMPMLTDREREQIKCEVADRITKRGEFRGELGG